MSFKSSPNQDAFHPIDTLDRTDHDSVENVKPDKDMSPPSFIQNWSEDERLEYEAGLRRKIDLRLLPMVIAMYIMNYLDRNNIASARIAGPDGKGLEDELGLSSTQYQVRCDSRI
jgi:MFS transporter, ACS family, DAL5 transporter family protein